MSLGNQMQFTLFNGDLFSKSAISQFLLGNILQTRQICLFMDCVEMDQETNFAQCPDPRRRPERRGEDDVIRRRSDDEEASKVVDMAPLKNIKEVTFFPKGGRRERIVYTSSQGAGGNHHEVGNTKSMKLSQF